LSNRHRNSPSPPSGPAAPTEEIQVFARVQDLLDQAAAGFLVGGEASPERAEQFYAHLATVRMVVDLTAAAVAKKETV
jgi:tartrate dehydratase beta subunit/fumarate hydratase class I family protein